MSNLYHILDKAPYLTEFDMPIELEKMACQLVNSGKLRIDAENKINFARFSIPEYGINKMFSKRELFSRRLLPNTKIILRHHFRRKVNNEQIDELVWSHISYMRKELKKYDDVEYELEMKLARILTQSIEPIVMKLLLLEEVEIFVSYSYDIGDMLDVITWQAAGQNSGMQSTNGIDCAVFVSSGGNPFRKNEQKNEIYGDGKPALARMMIIAAQEMGHYSDLIRNMNGNYVARHSANISCTNARDNVKIARIRDLHNVDIIRHKLESIGLKQLIYYEKHVKFFRQHKRSGILKLIYLLNTIVIRKFIRTFSYFISLGGYVKYFFRFTYVGISIDEMLLDMKFNLAPKADVYRKENPQEEEAIACVEALARVPQQKVKWGKKITASSMPNLWDIYYNQVIMRCKKDHKAMTNRDFNENFKKRRNFIYRFFAKIAYISKSFIKKKFSSS